MTELTMTSISEVFDIDRQDAQQVSQLIGALLATTYVRVMDLKASGQAAPNNVLHGISRLEETVDQFLNPDRRRMLPFIAYNEAIFQATHNLASALPDAALARFAELNRQQQSVEAT